MIRLRESLRAFGTGAFDDALKAEIERLDGAELPLQRALTATSCVAEGPHEAMIIGVSEDGGVIRVRAGIFYRGIVAGCGCADDPTPVEAQNEYCEVVFEIDKETAETRVALAAE